MNRRILTFQLDTEKHSQYLEPYSRKKKTDIALNSSNKALWIRMFKIYCKFTCLLSLYSLRNNTEERCYQACFIPVTCRATSAIKHHTLHLFNQTLFASHSQQGGLWCVMYWTVKHMNVSSYLTRGMDVLSAFFMFMLSCVGTGLSISRPPPPPNQGVLQNVQEGVIIS
jgi:hypothetical protein